VDRQFKVDGAGKYCIVHRILTGIYNIFQELYIHMNKTETNYASNHIFVFLGNRGFK